MKLNEHAAVRTHGDSHVSSHTFNVKSIRYTSCPENAGEACKDRFISLFEATFSFAIMLSVAS